jgi:hypothetical protein
VWSICNADDDYLKFVEQLSAPVTPLLSAEAQLEKRLTEEKELIGTRHTRQRALEKSLGVHACPNLLSLTLFHLNCHRPQRRQGAGDHVATAARDAATEEVALAEEECTLPVSSRDEANARGRLGSSSSWRQVRDERRKGERRKKRKDGKEKVADGAGGAGAGAAKSAAAEKRERTRKRDAERKERKAKAEKAGGGAGAGGRKGDGESKRRTKAVVDTKGPSWVAIQKQLEPGEIRIATREKPIAAAAPGSSAASAAKHNSQRVHTSLLASRLPFSPPDCRLALA